MITRLKFAAIAAFAGLILGLVTAWFIWREGESFPVYVIIPFVSLFGLCGAFLKKEWVDGVVDFFWNVM